MPTSPSLRARRVGLLALGFILVGWIAASCVTGWSGVRLGASTEDGSVIGPANGTVLVAGGGQLGKEIWERFVDAAGGPDAKIVIIPTASSDDDFPETWSGFMPLWEVGATNLTILHTRDRNDANSERFAKLLQEASGVWIVGGRQWRLVDAYLNTRVHEELHALLARGGVIGGTSAGASIQAEFLVRGDPDSNEVVIAPGYEEGFGFLTGTAVDQHLIARSRENDLWEVLALRPDLLGIGIDEGTALIVRGDVGEVVGSSEVYLYIPTDPIRTPRTLRAGAVVNLAQWMTLTIVVEPDDAEMDRSFR